MATNYRQEGRVLDWVNTTGADLASSRGALIAGNLFGIALEDIAAGAEGPMAIVNVFRFTKLAAADAYAVGAEVFYDTATGEATTAGDRIGRAAEPSASGLAYVDVLLNQPN